MLSKDKSSSLPAERQGIQVIARAASILRVLEHSPDGVSLGELAKAVSLPRSTVQRIVDALDNEGLVLAASTASGVRLGPALLALASATRFHIANIARKTLLTLAKEFGETVDLSILNQEKIVFVDQVAGTHRLTTRSSIGLVFPLHSTANGKALLAAMEDQDIAKLKRKIRLTPITTKTTTTWEQLHREINTIRKQGYALDREENTVGISAVSVAIRSPSGELAAISIPAPTHRFEAMEPQLIEKLLKHAGNLQRKLTR